MGMREIKISGLKMRWFIYAVLFGMAPIFLRLLVGSLTQGEKAISLLAPSDFIAFGIVLQVSIFNEIKYHDLDDAEWKHSMMGFSALLMLIYSGLYVLLLMSEIVDSVNVKAILNSSLIFSLISLLLCWVSYDRMSKSSEFGSRE
ncbi:MULTISPECIES: hypothetical protein [Pseudomonas]|uniref:Uncharacterized protein n=1 Tax=Pseudomonas mosselii TaxID=78327 RepID=A0A5R8YZX0_9PSED|nr:hypothetical protein [Pseudomonas mosselii]TLP59049.1 hypothetical protein FEM01_14175 [Pseudomonas mosselii]